MTLKQIRIEEGRHRKMAKHKPKRGVGKVRPPGLSLGFYSCTKHYDQEASWGIKGLFRLHFHITKEVRTGTQAGQEAGADAEAMEG